MWRFLGHDGLDSHAGAVQRQRSTKWGRELWVDQELDRAAIIEGEVEMRLVVPDDAQPALQPARFLRGG